MTLLGAYVVPHDRPVWSGGLVALLGEFGFSTGADREREVVGLVRGCVCRATRA
jgi:hypothetical protein